jgi:hypothetical protein
MRRDGITSLWSVCGGIECGAATSVLSRCFSPPFPFAAKVSHVFEYVACTDVYARCFFAFVVTCTARVPKAEVRACVRSETWKSGADKIVVGMLNTLTDTCGT